MTLLQNYGITNTKVGYETDKFDIYLYSKNLFNKGYKTRAFEVGGEWYARGGEARKIGAAFKYRF